MRKPQLMSVRLVWGQGDRRLRVGDWVKYRLESPNGNGNGNGHTRTFEYEGRVIALPMGLINPLKYVPVARDIEEMISRCQVDIVPIEAIVSGPHRILTTDDQIRRKL